MLQLEGTEQKNQAAIAIFKEEVAELKAKLAAWTGPPTQPTFPPSSGNLQKAKSNVQGVRVELMKGSGKQLHMFSQFGPVIFHVFLLCCASLFCLPVP